MMSLFEVQEHPNQILVVEDDDDAAKFVMRALARAGHEAVLATSAEEALQRIGSRRFSMMLTDVRMPGANGLELLAMVRTKDPTLPVVLMTAYGAMDDAIVALRGGAEDFLLKPLTLDSLQRAVVKALRARRHRGRRVLAIGAHPDDVEIGIGGTLIGHREAGDSVMLLTLTRGAGGGDASERAQESRSAAELLGAGLILGDLTDTRLREDRATVGLIEEVVADVGPDIVYTHTHQDVHQDHRATHEASLIACRSVPHLYCYQPPSATVDFAPRRFVNIDAFVERKLAAIGVYETQTSKCTYLAEDLTRSTARYWGRFCQSDFAEPLEVVRENADVHPENLSASSACKETNREEVHV